MKKIYPILLILLSFWLLSCTQDKSTDSQIKSVTISQLKAGDVQHDTLTKAQLEKIKKLSEIFKEVSKQPYEEWVDNFKRDMHPDAEIEVWEEIATAYTTFIEEKTLTQAQKEDVFEVLLIRSMMPVEEVLQQVKLEHISKEEALSAMKGYDKKEKPLTVKEQ